MISSAPGPGGARVLASAASSAPGGPAAGSTGGAVSAAVRGDPAASAPMRRLPIGAEVQASGGVHFRVWAPRARRVALVVAGAGASAPALDLEPEPGGYFAGHAPRAGAGTLYHFRLDDDERPYPDPASRFQPEGPHGPSCVVDAAGFVWTDAAWPGVSLAGQVLYELHVGTFTRKGTWNAAARELPELARLGIGVIEVMPVAEFPGRFGWGYDGVDLFAPTHLYGAPDDFRRFVDRAHACGLGVILDVVYNHLGPDGNYLSRFSDSYLSRRHHTDWGESINFDGEGSGPVREFYLANARYWIEEFHLDGLRLDATQDIHDRSPEHILAAVGATVRAAAGGRGTIVVAENEPQQARMVRPRAAGGYELDAMWNDDFHHTAIVALTGRAEAYYSDHRGTPQELISAAKRGFLYQGQWYSWQAQPRGSPALDLRPAQLVTFIQNHDQLANSLRGQRAHLLASPGRYRALTALLLLMPGTPMLFQGQEFAASSPFFYFADLPAPLDEAVRKGRAEFLSQFPSIASAAAQAALTDPGDPLTFERSKLDLAERTRHAEAYALHADLLRLRREDPVFSAQGANGLDGAVLGPESFVLRFFGGGSGNGSGDGSPDGSGRGAGDRLLLVNLGTQQLLRPAPEPLLAPPEGERWQRIWVSEALRYGGDELPELGREPWTLPARAAMVLASVPDREATR